MVERADKVGRTHVGRWVLRVGVVAVAVVAASCAPPAIPVTPIPIPVTEHLVDGGLAGVSFAKAADVTGDSTDELIVSKFGSPTTTPGTVTIYQRGADLDTWTEVPVVTPADGILFPNDTEVADLNGDGLEDLIVSGGFFSCSFSGTGCGSLQWYEQGPAGSFTRHDIVSPANSRFYHRAIVTDVDGDGITDVVTVGETFTTARTEWYRGTALEGADRFEDRARVIGAGGGSLPVVADVDGDGDDDVVSPQYFQPGTRPSSGSNARVSRHRRSPAGTWVRHTAAGANLGRGFEVELVPDLLGDGVARWIGTNHQNTNFDMTEDSAVFLFDPGVDPTQPWSRTTISTGIQSRPKSPTTLAPGLLGTGDVNGDDRIDVVVSGDGDERLFVLLQNADTSFTTYTLADRHGSGRRRRGHRSRRRRQARGPLHQLRAGRRQALRVRGLSTMRRRPVITAEAILAVLGVMAFTAGVTKRWVLDPLAEAFAELSPNGKAARRGAPGVRRRRRHRARTSAPPPLGHGCPTGGRGPGAATAGHESPAGP